jgi:hypothetical protein
MVDPRTGWAVCLSITAIGFVLAAAAKGWVDIVAAVLLFGGMIGSNVFLFLNRRAIPHDKRRGMWWWSDWNER